MIDIRHTKQDQNQAGNNAKLQKTKLLIRACSLVLAVALSTGFPTYAIAQQPDNPFRGKPPLVARSADAPNPLAEPPLDAATVAALDPLLEKKDWQSLRQAVQNLNNMDAFFSGLDWLKVRTDTGGSFMVPLLYSEALWLIANPAQNTSFQTQASFMAWYVVAIIRMDGLACGDTSAPSKRLEQVLAGPAGAALRYSAGLDPRVRALMIRLVVEREAATASRRAIEDETLCRGGMKELEAGMRAQNFGEPHTEPGQIGRVISVATPSDFKPSFRPKAEYEKQRAALRGADLYDYLWKLTVAK